jgi:hypothetical protein
MSEYNRVYLDLWSAMNGGRVELVLCIISKSRIQLLVTKFIITCKADKDRSSSAVAMDNQAKASLALSTSSPPRFLNSQPPHLKATPSLTTAL